MAILGSLRTCALNALIEIVIISSNYSYHFAFFIADQFARINIRALGSKNSRQIEIRQSEQANNAALPQCTTGLVTQLNTYAFLAGYDASNSFATVSMNCSVVLPSGPHKSWVPRFSWNSL